MLLMHPTYGSYDNDDHFDNIDNDNNCNKMINNDGENAIHDYHCSKYSIVMIVTDNITITYLLFRSFESRIVCSKCFKDHPHIQ